MPDIVNPIDYDAVADLYDVYVTVDDDVAFFVEEVRRVSGPVLELTAGTGRLSIPLVEAGARLTCVDAAGAMLSVLRRKLERRGLSAEVVEADVRRLALPARYALALIPFQSFMELVEERDQRETLAAVHRCLVPGGRLIVTLHNPAVRRATVDGVEREVGRFPTDDGTLRVTGVERGGDPVVERLQRFELLAPDGRRRWERELRMRFALIEPARLEAMAADAGFEIVSRWGSYDRAPFDPASSPVAVWALARR